MIDKNIPYKNIIMKCDQIKPIYSKPLLNDFYIKMYEDGFESYWAEIEADINDFDTYEEALSYFTSTYLSEKKLLKERCLFLFDKHNNPIATCTAWYDYKDGKKIPSLHWFATKTEYQGRGLGKLVLARVLEIFDNFNENPIYLHTQPWSYKAINIYHQFGFYLLKEETLTNYKNEYYDAIHELNKLYDDNIYQEIINNAR